MTVSLMQNRWSCRQKEGIARPSCLHLKTVAGAVTFTVAMFDFHPQAWAVPLGRLNRSKFGAPTGGEHKKAVSLHLSLPVALLATSAVAATTRHGRVRLRVGRETGGAVKDRPFVDQAITAGIKAVESLELRRVAASSEQPSEANGGWSGEPREWANAESLTQKISRVSQVGILADLKQFIADRLAGDYDRVAIRNLIETRVNSSSVMMFSFSTCPFCLRAKQLLTEVYGTELSVYECDLEPEGTAVRAELGKLTGRTSMPSVWLGLDVQLGGCNDGGLGGVATLHAEGRLSALLAERGALPSLPWWSSLLGQPDAREVMKRKTSLCNLCTEAPKNGVGAPEALQDQIEAAAVSLEQNCQADAARQPLTGIWDLLYCTAPGGSNGKIGPFVGDVTQTFLDETKFINAVQLGGVKVSLEAERSIIDDLKIKVIFKEMAFSIFDVEVFRKTIKGSGVWEQRFVDNELRVMNTPSLFVLRRRA